MKNTLDQIKDLKKVSNKSKVKFNGDFGKEMEKLMNLVETEVKKHILSKFRVEYTSYGNSSMKIKINDSDKAIEKLITCNFTYNKTDERYGYVDPQFLLNEIGKKTKIYDMGKYSILDSDKITKKFIKMLISIIEMY
ncbi:MAG: hypothetical protein PHS49_03545 [Candidatus Gracilibacteria bacterium]|nr:hypothetical protein [Candidatus Gracilibacteria bacterium]